MTATTGSAQPQRCRQPTQWMSTINGNEIALYHWASAKLDASAPAILFIHATGFHARCWDNVIDLLADYNVYAYDQRGHGLSGREGPFDWPQFGEDAVAVIQELRTKKGVQEIVGVAHSMGAYSLHYAAALDCTDIKGLVLIDPVMGDMLSPELGPDTSGVALRKNQFESPELMYQRFVGRQPYAQWQADAVHDYCFYGLRQEGDYYELSCPPAIEAQIYPGAFREDVYAMAEKINVPVVILRAKMHTPGEPISFLVSPTSPTLADHYPQGSDHYYPDLSHFIPMCKPDLVAQFVLDTVSS